MWCLVCTFIWSLLHGEEDRRCGGGDGRVTGVNWSGPLCWSCSGEGTGRSPPKSSHSHLRTLLPSREFFILFPRKRGDFSFVTKVINVLCCNKELFFPYLNKEIVWGASSVPHQVVIQGTSFLFLWDWRRKALTSYVNYVRALILSNGKHSLSLQFPSGCSRKELCLAHIGHASSLTNVSRMDGADCVHFPTFASAGKKSGERGKSSYFWFSWLDSIRPPALVAIGMGLWGPAMLPQLLSCS